MAHERRKVAPCVASCVDDRHSRFFLEVELPGVRKEDIKLTMHEDSLYLTAVRADGYIEYATTYGLCCPVKAEEAKAKYENGLLKIEVPFTEVLEGAVNIAVQ
jgi:HSP20 family protein